MTALLIGGAAYAGLLLLAFALCRAGDDALVDVGPEAVHDPDCGPCAVADDPTLTSFDLTLWAMECEASS